MHYGDDIQTEKEVLICVLYKHGTNKSPDYILKTLTKSQVDYEFASIQKCEFFPPNLLALIIRDPYNYLNKYMNDLPYEEWYELKIYSDGDNRITSVHIKNVTYDKKEIKRLH